MFLSSPKILKGIEDMLVQINKSLTIDPEYIEFIKDLGENKTQIVFNSGYIYELGIPYRKFIDILKGV